MTTRSAKEEDPAQAAAVLTVLVLRELQGRASGEVRGYRLSNHAAILPEEEVIAALVELPKPLRCRGSIDGDCLSIILTSIGTSVGLIAHGAHIAEAIEFFRRQFGVSASGSGTGLPRRVFLRGTKNESTVSFDAFCQWLRDFEIENRTLAIQPSPGGSQSNSGISEVSISRAGSIRRLTSE